MSVNGHKTSCTRIMYLRRKKKKRYIISSLHLSKRNNTPPNRMIQKLTLPLKVTTLISKTTPPFCHKLQRVECQVDISSVELAFPSASSEASSSSNSEATGEGGEGVASRAKPPIDAYHHAIRLTRMFT